MKAVLMLYPVKYFVDLDGRTCLLSLERYWNSVFQFRNGEFRQRCRLINLLLDQYRNKNFRVAWALFSSEHNREVCDESQISNVFQIGQEDLKIAVGITQAEHLTQYPPIVNENAEPKNYPDEKAVLAKMGKLEELVVGGFHKDDCVERFVRAGEKLGIRSSKDDLLTEDFFFKVMLSFEQDVYAKMIAEGNLDPKMHEDDPKKEKRLIFGNRLDKYL